jgi:hypothetical protein
MMYHRYGRHGPDAWERRRQRRFQQRLPAVIPTVAVVRIQAPVNAERIIFIVLNSPEDFEQNGSLPMQREQQISVQTIFQDENNPLTNRARIQAAEDIDDIKTLNEQEGQVTIVDKDVPKRAKILAKADVKSNYLSGALTLDEHKQYIEDYQAAYLDQFAKERRSIARDLRSFPDAKAVNLARKARVDKKTTFFPSSGRGPFHQRDLAVVSALYELELCQNLEEYLEKIHVYVDIYEDAFRSSKEEVVWPDPASF